MKLNGKIIKQIKEMAKKLHIDIYHDNSVQSLKFAEELNWEKTGYDFDLQMFLNEVDWDRATKVINPTQEFIETFKEKFKTKGKKYGNLKGLNKVSFEFILDNFDEFDWDGMALGSSKANKLIEQKLKKINTLKINKDSSFDETLEVVKFLLSMEVRLNQIKGINCSEYGGRRGSNVHSKQAGLHRLKINYKLDKIKYSKFTVPQNLIFQHVTEKREKIDGYYNYYSRFGDYELPEFNAVTEDKTPLYNLHKEVTEFDYKAYNLNKEEVTKDFMGSFEGRIETIDMFLNLKEHAGDDIVNWTQHKVTGRLRRVLGYPDANHWNISSYIEELVKHLKRSGVKIVKPKESSIQKTERKFEKDKTTPQEDLFRLFKGGSVDNVDNIISQMNFQTLLEIVHSDLKCVLERGKDNSHKIIQRILELSPDKEDKTTYNAILSFIRKHKKDYGGLQLNILSGSFFSKYLKYVTQKDFSEFVESVGWKEIEGISPELFDKFCTKIPITKQLKTNHSITNEFIVRMSEEEKLGILPKVKDLSVKTNHLNALYNDVPYKTLKSAIINLKKIRLNFADRVVQEKDFEFLEIMLREQEEIKLSHEYLNHFSYDKNMDIIISLINVDSNSWRCYKYYNHLDELFKVEELIIFLIAMIESEGFEKVIEEIINVLDRKKYPKKKIQELLLKSKSPCWPINDYTCIEYIVHNREVVKHVLKHNKLVKDKYGLEIYMTLLKTLNRKDVEEIYGEDFRKDLKLVFDVAHVLTEEEAIMYAEKSNDFLRKNLEVLPKSYLEKFKDPDEFKEAVGNRVHRNNKEFGFRLEARLSK